MGHRDTTRGEKDVTMEDSEMQSIRWDYLAIGLALWALALLVALLIGYWVSGWTWG